MLNEFFIHRILNCKPMLRMPTPLSVPQQQQTGAIIDQRTSMDDGAVIGQQQPTMPGGGLSGAQHFLKAPLASAVASASAGPSTSSGLPAVPPQCGPPTVSLALLIDFAVHWNYRQFEILSELNSKKKETDRKISVVEFAHNTRLIFVRLLAIVRWLKNAKKFEPLASIRYLLDEQAQRYIETADQLVVIARNQLPDARLPAFQVAQAVDVLTLGSFPRLPQNIKDRFIPSNPLSAVECRLTLRRLNRVIEFHLAQQAGQLSPRLRHITVRNGMAILLVPGEFEMALTRLGDQPTTQWTLLNIRILVEESTEIGEGQQLVHPLQVNFLHQIVQEKLDSSEKPLLEAYTVLHWFCRSLQLDILYCQALQIAKMSRSRGSDQSRYIRVDEYNEKECRLVISYWLRRDGSEASRLISPNRLTFFGDKNDAHSGLKIRHYPPSAELPGINSDNSFSLQQMLNETILFRCRERLLSVKQVVEAAHKHFLHNRKRKLGSSSTTGETPASPSSASSSSASASTHSPSLLPVIRQSGHSLLTINYPLIRFDDCKPEECLTLAINTFSGAVLARVDVLGQRDEMRELESQLNSSPAVFLHHCSSSSSLSSSPTIEAIARILSRLHILVVIERLNRALVGVQVNPLSEAQALPLMGKLSSLAPDRRIFQFIRDDQFYLVVTFVPDEEFVVRVEFHLFSSIDSRLSTLELDAEQIIRTAPLPRMAAGGRHTSAGSKSETFKEFCDRNRKKTAGKHRVKRPSIIKHK